MNNDLISRSELKKAIEELEITEELVDYDCDDFCKTGVSQYLDRPDVLDLIDNALTVDKFYDYNEGYKDGFSLGFKRGSESNERPQGEWIPVSERLPEEKINPLTNDFEEVLCTTIWGDVRVYKYGTPLGHEQAHFWYGGGIMDNEVIAWRPLPEPYKEGGVK